MTRTEDNVRDVGAVDAMTDERLVDAWVRQDLRQKFGLPLIGVPCEMLALLPRS